MPELNTVEAQLYVSNIKASCDYYVRLGFNVTFIHGEPAFYGQVRRDKALLNLRHVDEPVFVGDIREREILLSASLTVDSAQEIRHLFDEFALAGVNFKQRLEKQSWGALNFIVRDNDGNLLLFAGPAA